MREGESGEIKITFKKGKKKARTTPCYQNTVRSFTQAPRTSPSSPPSHPPPHPTPSSPTPPAPPPAPPPGLMPPVIIPIIAIELIKFPICGGIPICPMSPTSPPTYDCKIMLYWSSESPMPAKMLIFPSSSSPLFDEEGIPPLFAMGWTAEAMACSKEGSERGGIPTERGTRGRASCWMTLRCMRCFCRWQVRLSRSLINYIQG